MATYVISYDLNTPGQKYNDLYEKIKGLGLWWHNLDSTWIVVSSKKAAEIRDILSTCLDSNDKLIVIKSSGEGAWKGIPKSGSDWLLKNL